MQESHWRDVPGYGGLYEISSYGEIRDVSGAPHKRFMWNRYLGVRLERKGKTRDFRLHRLVAETFVPNPDNLPVVRHLNDDPLDNRVENLKWGTYSENQLDSVRNGTHAWAKKTHCPRGHAYSEFGQRNKYTGGRECQICRRDRARFNAEEGKVLSDDDPRHGTRGGYGYWRCRCEKCVEHNRDYRRTRRNRKRVVQ